MKVAHGGKSCLWALYRYLFIVIDVFVGCLSCTQCRKRNSKWLSVGEIQTNEPFVGNLKPKRPSVGDFRHSCQSVGTTLLSKFWGILVGKKQRVYANVPDIHDNEESPLHILLLTHSVEVEGFLYMWAYLPWHNTTKFRSEEQSYSTFGFGCVFHRLYSHKYNHFKKKIHTQVCASNWSQQELSLGINGLGDWPPTIITKVPCSVPGSTWVITYWGVLRFRASTEMSSSKHVIFDIMEPWVHNGDRGRGEFVNTLSRVLTNAEYNLRI